MLAHSYCNIFFLEEIIIEPCHEKACHKAVPNWFVVFFRKLAGRFSDNFQGKKKQHGLKMVNF